MLPLPSFSLKFITRKDLFFSILDQHLYYNYKDRRRKRQMATMVPKAMALQLWFQEFLCPPQASFSMMRHKSWYTELAT